MIEIQPQKPRERRNFLPVDLQQYPVMIGLTGHAGLMDLSAVDKYQAALFHQIGLLIDEIITFPLKQIINLAFRVKMLGGHGKFIISDYAVNCQPIRMLFEYRAFHERTPLPRIFYNTAAFVNTAHNYGLYCIRK